MPLPAILSISIFGGIFLLLTIYFYRKIKSLDKQLEKQSYGKLMQQNSEKQESKIEEKEQIPTQNTEKQKNQDKTLENNNPQIDLVNQVNAIIENNQNVQISSQNIVIIIETPQKNKNIKNEQDPQFSIQSTNIDPNQETPQGNQQINQNSQIEQCKKDLVQNHSQNQIENQNNLNKSQPKPCVGDYGNQITLSESQDNIEFDEKQNNNQKIHQVEVEVEVAINNEDANQQTSQPPILQQKEEEKDIIQNENNDIDSMKGSQLFNQTDDLQEAILNYEKVQYVFLAISCSVFIESITGRVYIQTQLQIIAFPQILLLALISSIIGLIIFNIFEYSVQLLYCLNQKAKTRIFYRISLIIYGLTMPFPIYMGLDKYIKLEFISVLFSILFLFLFQSILIKCKKIKNYDQLNQLPK